MGENNDCSVIALAVSCDLSYKDAHEILSQKGRKTGKGVLTNEILSAVVIAGKTHQNVTEIFKHNYGKTVGSIEKAGLKETYLVITSGHVLTMKDGKALDWTSGRSHRIQSVYRIR
jgi:hypothetical protein